MTQILPPPSVTIADAPATRDDAIRHAGQRLVQAGAVETEYVNAMLEREQSVSTYMGNFLAIPHGTNNSKEHIRSSALAVIRYDTDIDWGGEPVRFVIGIAGIGNEHLELLSNIAVIFSDEDAVAELLRAGTAEELHALLSGVNV